MSSADSKGLPPAQSHVDLADEVSEARLRHLVEQISVPRSFFAERAANVRIARWICDELRSYGLEPQLQGEYANVVAMTPSCRGRSCILIGAHYDSVPGSPGADDNGSAVAAMLVCAELLGRHRGELPFCFVAFNCEENGLLGSASFVEEFLAEHPLRITLAQVLEMPGSRCQAFIEKSKSRF